MIIGKNMILAIGDKVVAASKNCSISIKREMVEIAEQATSKSYIPGKYSFTISADGLYSIGDDSKVRSIDLCTTLIAGTKVSFAYTTSTIVGNTQTTEVCSGYAYIYSVSYSGARNSLATYSCSLQGTGAITKQATSRDVVTITPKFALRTKVGTQTVSKASGSTFTLAKTNVVWTTTSGEYLILRVYPNMKYLDDSVSDISQYLSLFLTSIEYWIEDSRPIPYPEEIISVSKTYADVKISLSSSFASSFKLVMAPDPDSNYINISLT